MTVPESRASSVDALADIYIYHWTLPFYLFKLFLFQPHFYGKYYGFNVCLFHQVGRRSLL